METKKITPALLKATNLEELFKLTNSSRQGLTTKEAQNRAREFGENILGQKIRFNTLRQFLGYFKNPLIIILMVAALISGATGQMRNMIIILSMIFLSIFLNFYQERKSNRAAEKIASRLAIQTKILRDGRQQELATKNVVPGDIIFLAAGDIVPADGKIISATDFFVNESSLTGESLPVEKEATNLNSIFSGTNIVSGFGQFLVVNTGLNTEFGQIADKIKRTETINAFEAGIKSFGFLIIRVIAIIVAIIFLINALMKKGVMDSFLFALAVAVGVTPELLPMIMSINMARGATKMSKDGVLVKKLNSIPTFGSMDVLCTDKTGTLTQDKITVIKHIDIFGNDAPKIFQIAYLNSYFETGIKNLLDQAILGYKTLDVAGYQKIEEIPYDFDRKRSSIIYEKDDRLVMITKGAPEEIFKISSHYETNAGRQALTPEILEKIKQLYDNLSSEGLRILAITEKQITVRKEIYQTSDESNLTLRGFMAFYDPPKQDVKEVLALMQAHGIAIKILTGDSPLVTKKICNEIGLEVKGIISGEDLDLNRLSSEEIFRKTSEATICARLSPSQKERIITELRKSGLIIGYLGDGINDAPSLKAADIGISVNNAVDVARETADIILLQKGLKELIAGVIEGRKTFGNTMKYLLMGLSSNFGNMFSMIGASLFLPFFPMTAGQILLNNFVYDASQLSIPSDKVDQEYLKKPKHWDINFIKKYMLVFGPISSFFDFLTFYVLFGLMHLNVATFQAGWFVESLATQILVIHIIRTRKKPFLESWPSKYLLATTLGAVLLGVFLTQNSISSFFGFSPLPKMALVLIFLIVIAYLLTVESAKQIFYRRLDKVEGRV